jgi:hypothetical protein
MAGARDRQHTERVQKCPQCSRPFPALGPASSTCWIWRAGTARGNQRPLMQDRASPKLPVPPRMLWGNPGGGGNHAALSPGLLTQLPVSAVSPVRWDNTIAMVCGVDEEGTTVKDKLDPICRSRTQVGPECAGYWRHRAALGAKCVQSRGTGRQ